MAKDEKIVVEFSPREFSIIWDAVNNKSLDIFKQSQKKGLEKWKKENLKKDYQEIKALLKFFDETARNFTINVKR